MGNEQSKGEDFDDFGTSAGKDGSKKVEYCRMDGKQMADFMAEDGDEDGESLSRVSLVKMAYNGIWSIVMPSGRAPCPRDLHFSAYSKQFQTLFIGYGLRPDGVMLNDVWALDCQTYKWSKLKLTGDEITPRTGAAATMMGNYIVVFGGQDKDGRYRGELHTIDVTTGEVMISTAAGNAPIPRKSAIIGIWKRRLYIWGGNDGKPIKDLNVLDFAQMRWGIVETTIPGRQFPAVAQVGSRLYAYGSGKNRDFIVVDMDLCNVFRQKAYGTIPSSLIIASGMVRVGGYLMNFGGKIKNKWTLVHGCELSRHWWFVFFVSPDGESTSIVDGRISSDGIFMLPRMYGFSACYNQEKREIIACLGHPHKSPPPVSIVKMGDALAVLNLREDMLGMLSMSLHERDEEIEQDDEDYGYDDYDDE